MPSGSGNKVNIVESGYYVLTDQINTFVNYSMQLSILRCNTYREI